MKKMVMACMCDVCGKQMDEKASRYAIRLGVGNWSNDVVQQTNEKDLCKDCYDTVRELLKFDQVQKPSVKKKTEVAASDGTVKKRKGGRQLRYDLEKVNELFCNGWTNRRIAKELNIPNGTIGRYIEMCEERGSTRGQNLLPDYQETPVRMRTVVDGSGFVVNVGGGA